MSEKQAPPETKPDEKKEESGDYPILKMLMDSWVLLSIVLLVWFLGAFGFSITWVIFPFMIYLWRRKGKKERDTKRLLRAGIAKDEKTFLARVNDLPSWVYFPDIEKAEWLNKIVKQVWPFLGDYTTELLNQRIGPSVAQAMPGPFKGFRFLKTDLGDEPPRIGGVKVYTDQLNRDEVVMDLEVFYAGDCDITVTVGKKLNAGISDLTLHGQLRVVFAPLVKQMPLIGGIQAFFLNRPDIDFNLKSLANAFDVPGLSDLLRNIVTDQVAAMMVLPNKIKVPLIQGLDPDKITYLLPKYVLRVCIINAKDLKRADFAVIGKGSSDPYVKVIVGAEEYKTKIQKKTIEPIWNEWFEFVLETSPYGRRIEFEVMDDDSADKNDELGTVDFQLDEVAKRGEFDSWLSLENVDTGVLHVRAELLKLSEKKEDLDKINLADAQKSQASKANDDRPLSTCLVTVKLDCAKALPNEASGKNYSEPDPFAVVRIGNVHKESALKKNTMNPRWEEQFVYLCRDIAVQDIDIQIWNKKKGKKPLGTLSVPLKSILDYPDMSSMQWYSLKESGPESQLHLGICVRALMRSDGESPPDLTDMAGYPLLAAFQGPQSLTDGEDIVEPGSSGPASPTGSTAPSSPAVADVNGADHNENAPKDQSGDTDSVTNVNELRRRIQESNMKPATEEDKGFGKIQLTIRYSAHRQKLVVVVHKCINLLPCDSDHLADPWVRLYLLPDKHKQKTQVHKDTLNPVFDETFEFSVSLSDVESRSLSVALKNKNSLFSKARKEMGTLNIPLGSVDVTRISTEWYDLEDPDSGEKDD